LDIPIVYLSAAADDRLVEEAIGSGSFGYLVKPFEERELHATIQAALYKHRVEQLLREDVRRYAALLERTGQIARIGGWELAIPSLELTWSAELYRIHEMERTRRPTWAEAISFCAPESRPILEAAVRQPSRMGHRMTWNWHSARLVMPGCAPKARRSGKMAKSSGSSAAFRTSPNAVKPPKRCAGRRRFRTLYDATSDAVMVLMSAFSRLQPAILAIFGCASWGALLEAPGRCLTAPATVRYGFADAGQPADCRMALKAGDHAV
jgi:CheY-like chemotaxis protein